MSKNRAILRFALTGLVAALLAGPAPSWSQAPAPEAGAKANALPAELLRAAKRWKVDLKDVTIAVLPVDDVRRTEKDSNVARIRPALLHRADVSVAPASSAKVVTTLVALETLGSHYRWYTGFYADEKAGPDAKGVLRSPLYIKGGGDPNFVLEAFDLELTRQAARAVNVPVIASGGAGRMADFYDVLTAGEADAALAASLFHFGIINMRDLKKYLAERGVLVRTEGL